MLSPYDQSRLQEEERTEVELHSFFTFGGDLKERRYLSDWGDVGNFAILGNGFNHLSFLFYVIRGHCLEPPCHVYFIEFYI